MMSHEHTHDEQQDQRNRTTSAVLTDSHMARLSPMGMEFQSDKAVIDRILLQAKKASEEHETQPLLHQSFDVSKAPTELRAPGNSMVQTGFSNLTINFSRGQQRARD